MKTKLNPATARSGRAETQRNRIPGTRPCRAGGPCLPSQICRGCPKSKPAPESNPDLIEVNVAPATAEAIGDALRNLTQRHRFMPDRDAREIQALVGEILAAHLPPAEIAAIKRFGSGIAEPILVVRGLPKQDSLPPSPFRGFCDDSKTAFADSLLLGVYGIAGIEPVSFEYENHGLLLRNVTPVIGSEGVKSSHGYDVELGWHTDNPCGPFEQGVGNAAALLALLRSPIPSILGFTGVRNADAQGHPVPTRVLPTLRVLHRVESDVNEALHRLEYQVNAPASNATAPLVEVPLVEAGLGGALIRFNGDPNQVHGLTARAQRALDAFKSKAAECEDLVVPISVDLGTVMAFDNRRVAHMRSAFNPGTDLSKARWMRRCYGYLDSRSGLFVDPGHWPHLRK